MPILLIIYVDDLNSLGRLITSHITTMLGERFENIIIFEYELLGLGFSYSVNSRKRFN